MDKRHKPKILLAVTAMLFFLQSVLLLMPELTQAKRPGKRTTSQSEPAQAKRPGKRAASQSKPAQARRPGKRKASQSKPAQARRPGKRKVSQPGPAWTGPRHKTRELRPGAVVTRIPKRHQKVRVRDNRYYYHNGIFYHSKKPKRYVVVTPPVGAVVRSLPLVYTTAFVAGMTYHLAAGTYYRPVTGGYSIVTPPTPTAATHSDVWVTAGMLNVRQGPGLIHPVLSQVAGGTRLTVYGNAPGWLYVLLPGGGYGWVMVQYTRGSYSGVPG